MGRGVGLGVLLLVLVVVGETEGCGRGSIYLMNNGYRQVLIAVGEDVPDNPSLIDRIKTVFTDTSALLYNATRRRAYFEEINILVPKTWARRPEYEVAGDEAIDKSDILVDKPDARFNQGDSPFVIKSTPCGELGHYMHITPDYLMKKDVSEPYGPYEKVLIHEWAHLRYGVFDEYPTGNEPHFYSSAGGGIQAVRCSLELEGEMYDKDSNSRMCGSQGFLPDNNCRFRDYEDADEFEPAYASLMYRQYLKHLVSFCDNDPKQPKVLHNKEAPNQQNKKCAGRSVWEVMREHGDFKGANPERNITNTTPRFRVLQAQINRYVLVLDVSGSMRGTRIANLARSCSNFIRNIIRDGEKLGITTFSTAARRTHNIVTVSNETRDSLLLGIPLQTRSRTSIGAGILDALKMLEGDGGTKGASLIVVTDGEENQNPRIGNVRQTVLNAKVTLHTIAFTNKASTSVDVLAKETGGLTFLYTGTGQSNALNEAFRSIADLNQNIKDKKIPISSEAQDLEALGEFSHQVSIDSTLGSDTEFIFDYSGPDIDIHLTSPGGLQYFKNSTIVSHDSSFGIYTFAFTGRGETGRWKYKVTSPVIVPQKVAVSVVSKTAVAGKYPIIAQAYWGKRGLDHRNRGLQQALYASVSQGYSAVLSADVKALVETPNGATVELQLYDNGAGADQTKDDGIYSAYYVQFNGNGRYNVKVIVNSVEATRISSIRIIGRGAATESADKYESSVKVTDLERTTSGGAFELSSFQRGKVYLPGRVTDMDVTAVNFNMKEVVLSWTAPGAELDRGRVSEYEVRYGTDYDSMFSNFTDQTLVLPSMVQAGNLSNPGLAGERETFAIRVPASGDITYVFGMISFDTDGRMVESEVSNLVSAGMVAFEKNKTNRTAVIVGAIFGTLVFIAIVVVLGIAFRRFKKSRSTMQA